MLIPISKVVVLLKRLMPSGSCPSARNLSSISLARFLLICAVCSSDFNVENLGLLTPATQRAIMSASEGANDRSSRVPLHAFRGQHVLAEYAVTMPQRLHMRRDVEATFTTRSRSWSSFHIPRASISSDCFISRFQISAARLS